jgi:hypothetical protein
MRGPGSANSDPITFKNLTKQNLLKDENRKESFTRHVSGVSSRVHFSRQPGNFNASLKIFKFKNVLSS